MFEYLNKLHSVIEKSDKPKIIGIDEAGRGPVVGPMVYAVYVADINQKSDFKDSKMLTPKSRDDFFQRMSNYAYIVIDPVYITTHMEAKSKNLNMIAMESVLYLLKEVEKKCTNVKCVYIDGLGDNSYYKKFLQKYFAFDFIIENKADEKYQPVSAASIVAKVTRDSIISKIGCGSGYPGDPVTKKWLLSKIDNFLGFPNCVRHSWKTVKNLLSKKKSKKFSGNLSLFYINKN